MAARLMPSKGSKPDKPFRDALRMEIASDAKLMRRVAKAILDKAADGDVTAAREIADRLDGKVSTTPFDLSLSEMGDGSRISSIEVHFVTADYKTIEHEPVPLKNGHDR